MEATFIDAIDKVDRYLAALSGRNLLPVADVSDVLLDVRLDLAALQQMYTPMPEGLESAAQPV